MPASEIIVRCDHCSHAALYSNPENGEYLCGAHGRKASIFAYPAQSDSIRKAQARADAALAARVARDESDLGINLGGSPMSDG